MVYYNLYINNRASVADILLPTGSYMAGILLAVIKASHE